VRAPGSGRPSYRRSQDLRDHDIWATTVAGVADRDGLHPCGHGGDRAIWNILSDGDFGMVLANAAHIKNVPGRKTDVSATRSGLPTWRPTA
jgi:hypothetical protein